MIDKIHLFLNRIYWYLKFLNWVKNFKNNNFAKKNIILVELFPFYPSHINFFYFANFLSKKHSAKIISFYPHPCNFLVKIFRYIGLIPHQIIHKSYGSKDLLFYNFPQKKENEIISSAEQKFNKLKSKKDLLFFKINKVRIGDLIYDDYLTKYKKPTIELNSKNLKNHFIKGVLLYFYWENYFKKNSVKSIIASHPTYYTAMSTRVGLSKNIECFQVNPTQAIRLNKKDYLKNFECYFFKHQFKKYDNNLKKRYFRESQKLLKYRFEGNETIDKIINAPAKHMFEKRIKVKKNIKSKKTKVLVALHSFDDSPHCFGDLIFDDFYDWLEFLGKKTNEHEYEWLLKIHPSMYDGNIETIKFFVKKYPKFKLLPINTTHTKLLSRGIDCVLTVFGSIGFEYAYYGVPVINCCECYPGVAYDFNLNAKNIKQYNKLISSIPKLKLKIRKKDVVEYYFMRYLDNFIFWKNFNNTWEKLKKYNLGKFSGHNDPLIYKFWLEQFDSKRNSHLFESLEKFYKSKDFKMTRRHSPRIINKDFVWSQKELY